MKLKHAVLLLALSSPVYFFFLSGSLLDERWPKLKPTLLVRFYLVTCASFVVWFIFVYLFLHALKMSFCKKKHVSFLVSSCTDLIPNLRNGTLLCTCCFHVLSMVLPRSQKFVLKCVCIKGVSVTWCVSEQFILHTKLFLKKYEWLLNRIC